MTKSIALIIGLISFGAFAQNFDCKIAGYSLLEGETKYAVADKYTSIKINTVYGPTAEERRSLCSSKKPGQAYIQILAQTDKGELDITHCETQDYLLVKEESVNYYNFNDHDAPEESLIINKIERQTPSPYRTRYNYHARMISKWDTTELLDMWCRKI